MHFGFVVARTDWASLHSALQTRCGELSEVGSIEPSEWFDTPSGQDVFHVASADGTTFMLDPSMVLSANCDLIADLARELSCLVVGAGAETVSGSFWMTAAEGPDLRRLYFHVVATMTQPFSLGDPLPSEASVEWTHIDGNGIFARMSDLGLDKSVLDEGPSGGAMRVAWVDIELPKPGPLRAQINQHCEAFKRADADDWMKNITVQSRGQDSFDLTGSTGKPRKPSKLRGLFQRGA